MASGVGRAAQTLVWSVILVVGALRAVQADVPPAVAPTPAPSASPRPMNNHPFVFTITPLYQFAAGSDQEPSTGGVVTHHDFQLNYAATIALGGGLQAFFQHMIVDPTPEGVLIDGHAIYPGEVAEYVNTMGVRRTFGSHVTLGLGWLDRVHDYPVNDASVSCTKIGNCGEIDGYQGPALFVHANYGPYGPLRAVVTYDATVVQVLRSPNPALQALANAEKQPLSPGLPILSTDLLGLQLTRFAPLQPFIKVGTQEDEFGTKIHPTSENIVWFGVIHPISRSASLQIDDYNFRGTHQGVTFPGAETTRFNVAAIKLNFTVSP